MASTAPIHGPLPGPISVVLVQAIAVAAHNDLVALHLLDGVTAPRPTVGTRWMQLLQSLVEPNGDVVPSAMPTAAQVHEALAATTESERFTVLEILGEVSLFLSAAGVQLARRIEALPDDKQPAAWQDALRGVMASARSLGQLSRPQGVDPQVLSGILISLLVPSPVPAAPRE